MFAPWRSQKSWRKHKNPITGNSSIQVFPVLLRIGEKVDVKNFTGVDPARSNSLTDVRQASDDLFKSEKPHSRPSSGRRSSTPGPSDKSESWPSEFLGK